MLPSYSWRARAVPSSGWPARYVLMYSSATASYSVSSVCAPKLLATGSKTVSRTRRNEKIFRKELSLTLDFSPVQPTEVDENRFNGFAADGEPLKWLMSSRVSTPGLSRV